MKITLVNPGFVRTPLTDRNSFNMPFLISADEAVDQIISGLKKDKFEIKFPTQFALIMKILSILPYRIYFYLTKWMSK